MQGGDKILFGKGDPGDIAWRGVVLLIVNGKKLPGNLIPLGAMKDVNTVEAILGRE